MKKPYAMTLAACGITAATFVVYAFTVAPSIQAGDAGELSTAAATLGIAHPTGYPLFTLMENLVSRIPGGNAAWRMNLSTAVFCAVANAFLFLVFRGLLNKEETSAFVKPAPRALQKDAAAPARPGLPEWLRQWILPASAVTALAFSKTYWSQAVSLEVYSLHLLLLSSVLWAFLNFLRGDPREARTKKWGCGFGILLGLAFSNHLTTVLLLPGLLLLYLWERGFTRTTWRPLPTITVGLLAGLLPYLYLPLRASMNPLINWGDPSSWERFIQHVSGAQFRAKMFASSEAAQSGIARYFGSLGAEFGYPLLALALLGLGVLAGRSRRLLAFSLALFLACLLYAANYDIPDIEAYFLLANIAVAFWILHGLTFCSEILVRMRLGWGAVGLCALVAAIPAVSHFEDLDRSDDFVVEDYVRNVIEPLDSGAVVLSDEEQDFLFPALHLQWVESLRPDVAVVNIHLMRFTWYLDFMTQAYPDILEGSEKEMASYRRALQVSGRYGLGPIGSAAMQAASLEEGRLWNEVIRALVLRNAGRRPVHATSSLAIRGNANLDLNSGLEKLPVGLTFRFFEPGSIIAQPYREYRIREMPSRNPRSQAVRSYYVSGYVNQGLYHGVLLRDTATGLRSFENARRLNPGDPQVLAGLARLNRPL